MREYSLTILKIVELIGSTRCRIKPLSSPLMLKLMILTTSFLIHKSETQNFEDQVEENKNLQEFCVVNSGSDYLIELLLANSANLALVAKGVDPPEEGDEF